MGGGPCVAAQEGDAWDREVGDTKVLVEWGREGDEFDVETHVVRRTVGFNTMVGEEVQGGGIEVGIRDRLL